MKLEPLMFNHPLMDNLPSVPDADKLGEIVTQIYWGDQKAKELLIQYLMLVAKRCVGTILAVYPGNWNELEDMVSEAALTVVTLVDKFITGDPPVHHTKLLNYTAVAVLQQVNEMLMKNSVIPIPVMSQIRNWKKGKEALVKFSNDALDGVPVDTESDFEFRDALEAIISTPIERRILELREAGYTDAEIGEEVGLSQQTISLLRLNLYQRYVEAIQ
jgi:DNA-directed RNA polymerase specialized sigma subunit